MKEPKGGEGDALKKKVRIGQGVVV